MIIYPGFFPDEGLLPEYRCPICGTQLDGGDTVAENTDGDTVGCTYCIRYYEAWEKLTDENYRH